ncbi:hypothetical protein SEA_ARACELI_56 [Streptomyces phage Araceli]|nr:hypothetical protein SEA_HENOCCUS_57 [Streptomyces phage Henoccus]AWY07375.1 hypothetical protein SEA_JACKIEB_57 [Streptomyces phage JackieB]QFG07870.1 hypothetical protein SEA_ARACELI_56 [Streptomyces phage Araceli]
MPDEVTIVDRPYEPVTTEKKSLRTPAETVELARRTPGKAVVHSEGHTSKNAARSAVKRIHSGQFSAWKEFHGRLHAYVIDYDDDTFGVAVTWLTDEEMARRNAGRTAR